MSLVVTEVAYEASIVFLIRHIVRISAEQELVLRIQDRFLTMDRFWWAEEGCPLSLCQRATKSFEYEDASPPYLQTLLISGRLLKKY